MSVNEEQQPQQRGFIHGWEQPCLACPFRDFYFSQKNLVNMNQLLQRQQQEINRLNSQLKDKEEKDKQDEPTEE